MFRGFVVLQTCPTTLAFYLIILAVTAMIATPTFSPAADTYSPIQTVTISDATSGATTYYTTDGTAPTTSSTKYSGPTVSSSETLESIALESDYTSSAVAVATNTIQPARKVEVSACEHC